eukprot:103356-Amphidinium_carterae.1
MLQISVQKPQICDTHESDMSFGNYFNFPKPIKTGCAVRSNCMMVWYRWKPVTQATKASLSANKCRNCKTPLQ